MNSIVERLAGEPIIFDPKLAPPETDFGTPESVSTEYVTLQIDGAASLGSEIFPLGDEARSTPFEGFHRAVTPDVLK